MYLKDLLFLYAVLFAFTQLFNWFTKTDMNIPMIGLFILIGAIYLSFRTEDKPKESKIIGDEV